jgi:DNA-binding MarR family transcriptional regulator
MHMNEREHMHLFGMGAMTMAERSKRRRDAATPVETNPAMCNCLAIRQAARQVTQLYDGYLAPVGLRSSQYSILSRLNRAGPLSINELATQMVMDRTTIGRAVRPLERDGLVEVGSGGDARTRVVQLTAAGRKKVQSAQPRWRQAQAHFESSYGAGAAADLRTALGRVVTEV